MFVNVIRTLWHEDTPDGEQRRAAMRAVSSPPVALALAQLVGRSKRYPILINEGIVALTLLSLHSGASSRLTDVLFTTCLTCASNSLLWTIVFFAANVVLDAITTPLPLETQGSSGPGSAGESEIGSPVTTPGRAADTLAHLLRGHGAKVPEEVRANACILLGQVGREDGVGAERVPELLKLKLELRPLLSSAAESEKEVRLKAAAAGALQRWG